MQKTTLKQLATNALINRKREFIYSNPKIKLALIKLCIMSDILLDTPQYVHLAEIKATYTTNEEIIATYTNEECFAIFLKTTIEFLFQDTKLKDSNFLLDCTNATTDVIKYVTLQQKIDPAVILNYIRYLSLETYMCESISKRARQYIDSLKLSNHTYNITGKNIFGMNRTLDKVLAEIIKLERQNYNLLD